MRENMKFLLRSCSKVYVSSDLMHEDTDKYGTVHTAWNPGNIRDGELAYF